MISSAKQDHSRPLNQVVRQAMMSMAKSTGELQNVLSVIMFILKNGGITRLMRSMSTPSQHYRLIKRHYAGHVK